MDLLNDETVKWQMTVYAYNQIGWPIVKIGFLTSKVVIQPMKELWKQTTYLLQSAGGYVDSQLNCNFE